MAWGPTVRTSRTLVVGLAAALLSLTGFAVPAHADVPGNDLQSGATALVDNTPVSEDTTGATLTDDEKSLEYQYLQVGSATNGVWFTYTATSSWAKISATGSQSTQFIVVNAAGTPVSWGSPAPWLATAGATYHVLALAMGPAGDVTVSVDPSNPTPMIEASASSVDINSDGQTYITGSYRCTGSYARGGFSVKSADRSSYVADAFLTGSLVCDGATHSLTAIVHFSLPNPPLQVWLEGSFQSCVPWGSVLGAIRGPGPEVCGSATSSGLYDVHGEFVPPPPPPPPPAATVTLQGTQLLLGRGKVASAVVGYRCTGPVVYDWLSWTVEAVLRNGQPGPFVTGSGQYVPLTCDGTSRMVTVALHLLRPLRPGGLYDVDTSINVVTAADQSASDQRLDRVTVPVPAHPRGQ